jgi:hypothetical protein
MEEICERLLLSRRFLAWFILPYWRWRRYVPPKLRLTFKGIHGAISQKIRTLYQYITTAAGLSKTHPSTKLKNNAVSNIRLHIFNFELKQGLVWSRDYRNDSANKTSYCFESFDTWQTLTHSWNWAILQKLPIVQSLKKFPPFYGTRRFIIVFTRALH